MYSLGKCRRPNLRRWPLHLRAESVTLTGINIPFLTGYAGIATTLKNAGIKATFFMYVIFLITTRLSFFYVFFFLSSNGNNCMCFMKKSLSSFILMSVVDECVYDSSMVSSLKAAFAGAFRVYAVSNIFLTHYRRP